MIKINFEKWRQISTEKSCFVLKAKAPIPNKAVTSMRQKIGIFKEAFAVVIFKEVFVIENKFFYFL